jgi:hypothetical protein
MAAYTLAPAGGPLGVNKTLSGTTADTITVGPYDRYRLIVLNRSTATIYFRPDGVTAVAAADGTVPVPAGVAFDWNESGTTVVSVVGSGDAYSVVAIPRGSE